ncbi:HAUS augmin-like complex subunit 1 isoform X2 [Brienomyrus brachyistius]|uniref:HAUS augmin-like complex subunit 1 isoform X2 n=1 Tax=Brienomyrus brachyistius TaxID=42636 RepID=UPI0020B1D5DF|nr:HAUS augmin-like complex subunit 1 isoform X2 [Brienomyrus brachyistius]
MCEKITKVMQSLTKLVGDQPIPEYEVNTKTIDILYQLAENSDARCNQVSLLIEDHKQKAVEYHAESCHLQDVLLQGAGLSSGSLSKLASDNMATLNSCAMTLKLKDTSLTSRLMEAEKKNRDMERELTTLRKKLGAILVLRKILQEDLSKTAKAQEVENAKAEERLLNMDFIKAKSKDLSFTIKMTEEKIASRKMDYSLTHQAILEVSEDIAKLKQEILPLQKKLKSFRDLTPSPSLAQVKIEEAKRELAVIDAELEMKVDIVNLTTK